ncbi:uncharacterized protein LOC136086832 [Hydra vulgaris]|uniref:Uncharacterized protein LOC136086832 n=1 Tax=Hydra vulgaris TaxID=6087 RepID=A0ABM4CTZ5_HYDVU
MTFIAIVIMYNIKQIKEIGTPENLVAKTVGDSPSNFGVASYYWRKYRLIHYKKFDACSYPEVIGKNKQDHGNTLPKYVYTEDERTVVNERKIIAESFNNFFINAGQNLANKITPGNKNFKSYIKEEDCGMDELEVYPDELRFAFNILKPNKSSGLDDISPGVVKEVFDIIENPLLTIFNLSFNKSIFPDLLKLARVVPIFKDGDISKLSNYRPISILPCFSKILER